MILVSIELGVQRHSSYMGQEAGKENLSERKLPFSRHPDIPPSSGSVSLS